MEAGESRYQRNFDFGGWPVSSEVELADYAEWLAGLLAEHSGAEPQARIEVVVSGREREAPMPLAEFRERLDEFPFETIFSALVDVRDRDGSLAVRFEMSKHMLGTDSGQVRISGLDKGRVERVKAGVKRDGDSRLERWKELEAAKKRERERVGADLGEVAGAIFEAEAKRERERQRRPAPRRRAAKSASPEAPQRSRFKRFINHQWTVAVGAALIATILGGLALALILH